MMGWYYYFYNLLLQTILIFVFGESFLEWHIAIIFIIYVIPINFGVYTILGALSNRTIAYSGIKGFRKVLIFLIPNLTCSLICPLSMMFFNGNLDYDDFMILISISVPHLILIILVLLGYFLQRRFNTFD